MVRKIYIQMTVFVAFFVFILITNVDKVFVANQSDLNKIMDVVLKNNGSLTEWSIFAREDLVSSNEVEIEEMKKSWQKQFSQFTWNEERTSSSWKVIGTNTNDDLHYQEKLQITLNLKSNTLQGFVLYELKGSEWNEKTENLITEKHKETINHIFPIKPIIFSTVKGEFSDMMELDVSLKALELNKELNGEVVEQLSEKNFVSLTAKSSSFTQALKSTKGQFNVQIALRKNVQEGNTNFVVGTPILTIEY